MTWLVQKGLEQDKPAAREAAKLLLLEAPLEVVQPLVAKVRAAIRSGSKKSLDFAVGLHELLAKDPTWTADLVKLASSSESGNRIVALSLLLEWRREGIRNGRAIRYLNLPANLKSLAELYGVTELLGDE